MRPAVDFETLQFVLVLQARTGGAEPMTRRVLVTIVVIVTALLLQSTLFWQLKLLGVRPELMFLVTIVIAHPRGAAARAPSPGSQRAWRRTSC